MFLSLLNWLTFAWLLVLALRSVHQIVKGDRISVNFVIPVVFVFCGLPLLLDEVVGKPKYEQQMGFALASSDAITNIVYCLYMLIVPVFLLWIGRPASKCCKRPPGLLLQKNLWPPKGLKFWNRFILYALLMSPAALVLFSPDPGQYFVFSATLRFSDFYPDAHGGIALACRFSVLAGVFLIAICRPAIYGRWPNVRTVLAVTPWLLIAVWIHGKRSIVAIAGALLVIALHYRGVLRGAKAYFLVALVFIGVLSYSFFFQAYSGRVNTTWYENVRIDYGRDDKIKMTIYAELHPEIMQVLEWRGQSLIFYLTAFIPREIWPEKPLPYAQYFTSAMFLVSPRLWGWGMTTSWLEEAVANFGWLGLLVGPLLIGSVCRVGDRSQNSLVLLLTPLVAILFLLVEAVSFAPLFLLWLALVFRERVRSIRLAKGNLI